MRSRAALPPQTSGESQACASLPDLNTVIRVIPIATRRAFSLVELVIVVAIIAVIGAIAIPRISASSENAYAAAMLKDWRELQNAGERFKAEHAGIGIGVDNRSNPVSSITVVRRLTKITDASGAPNASGIYGPYLGKIPKNRDNNKQSIRVNGALPGAGTHGWRLDSSTGVIVPDTTEAIDILDNFGASGFHDGVVDLGP